MAEDLKGRILSLAHNLGEMLKSSDFSEAYQTAGELNSLLQSEEKIDLPLNVIADLISLVKAYFSQNKEMQEHTQKMYGIGNKLLDIK